MDHLCYLYLCLVFVMLSHQFIAALWSHAGKELTSWLLLLMPNCGSVTFPCGILGQVWYMYLIVLIPDFAIFLTFTMKLLSTFSPIIIESSMCTSNEAI